MSSMGTQQVGSPSTVNRDGFVFNGGQGAHNCLESLDTVVGSVGMVFQGCVRWMINATVAGAAVAMVGAGEPAAASELCADGAWATVMVGSHHIHPIQHFEDFNPGVGLECSATPQWAASFGYFRNSLNRPSFYGGAVYTPEFAHWSWFRLGAMGGVISGYNYGRYGVGPHNRTGPVLAPAAIVQFGKIGANVILIPPIRADNLPFTIGLQVKYLVN